MRLLTLSLLLSAVAFGPLAFAQQGDREGHVMNPPPAHWQIPAAPVLTPEEAMQSFAVEKGFRIELVAAEPMVVDPVALAFDGDGRMWVAEMWGYMPDIDGATEEQTFGRISVLEDLDNDGRMDRHQIFIEKVLLPRAIAFTDADHSLLYSDNNSLYEVEILTDEKGKITAGKQEVVDIDYAKGGNPEHKPNGLLYGLDNWFYSSKCNLRYRKMNGQWIKEKTESRGQWGIDQDDYGRLYTNTNSNFVSAETVPPGLSQRNPNYRFRAPLSSRLKDQHVWPSRINAGVNRGYMESTLDENGFLKGPTAVSGLAVYRGDQFPKEFYGNLFLNEPGGNLVKRATISENNGGDFLIESAKQKEEFFTSTDERSRIVNCYTAPDGTLYLVDFYRGILQHAAYMTSFLRQQVLDRKLHEPVGLGRIWRIVHENGRALPVERPTMSQMPAIELVSKLGHPNAWWRSTAQRILVQRGEKPSEVIEALQQQIESDNKDAAIHALWTLLGLDALSYASLQAAFGHTHSRVISAGLQMVPFLSPENGQPQSILEGFKELATHDDLVVKRQLAAALGTIEGGTDLLVALLANNKSDQLLLDMAMSGISGKEIQTLTKVDLVHPIRTSLIEAIVKANRPNELNTLAQSINSEGDFASFGTALISNRRSRALVSFFGLLELESTSPSFRKAAITGMKRATKDKRYKKITLEESHPFFASEESEDLGSFFQIGKGKEVTYLKSKDDKRLFKEGESHYQRICMACHQANGMGQKFLAPPLVGSEWVLESKERLLALVMDGVQGPMEVMGKMYAAPEVQPLMPGLRANPEVNDAQLAAILTYVRNAWGNGGEGFRVKEVADYRKATKLRAPYTAEELLKIK